MRKLMIVAIPTSPTVHGSDCWTISMTGVGKNGRSRSKLYLHVSKYFYHSTMTVMSTAERVPVAPPAPVVTARSPEPAASARKPHRPRAATAQRREAILQAAMVTFGAKGYYNGSLAEVAEQVGMTHAGVLHHFGSKDQLLLEVLEYRDRTDVEHLAGQQVPGGLGLFEHLVKTARLNAERPGIVQTYAVLSAEAVTEDHPGQAWFRQRYAVLRGEVRQALTEVCDPSDPPSEADLDAAAASVLAVMDGLQVQWLLDRDQVDLARHTAFAIEAILAAAVRGRRRVPVLRHDAVADPDA